VPQILPATLKVRPCSPLISTDKQLAFQRKQLDHEVPYNPQTLGDKQSEPSSSSPALTAAVGGPILHGRPPRATRLTTTLPPPRAARRAGPLART
jgi:hypothetical protein